MNQHAIPPENWGADHWDFFQYVETCLVYHNPISNAMVPDKPVILRDGSAVDTDCMLDFITAGLVVGDTPLELTEYGWLVAAALRRWLADGLYSKDFFIESAYDFRNGVESAQAYLINVQAGRATLEGSRLERLQELLTKIMRVLPVHNRVSRDQKHYFASVRFDYITPMHTTFSVFSAMGYTDEQTRGGCGSITMRNDEAMHFILHLNPVRVSTMQGVTPPFWAAKLPKFEG
jgi:hypothetical protein